MKLPLYLFACGAILTLAFRTYQPAIPLTRNDTDKPKVGVVSIKNSKDSTFESSGGRIWITSSGTITQHEYKSSYGEKFFGRAWVIKDTMRLINALLYDLWSTSSRTAGQLLADTGEIWYGSQIEMLKGIQRLNRDSITRVYVDSLFPMNDSLYALDTGLIWYGGKISNPSLPAPLKAPSANWIQRPYPRPYPRPIPDTTKPSYEYFYHIKIPINKLSPPLDTIQLVANRIGESMSVDRANELRAILFAQVNSLLGRPALDSIKVGGGK